jgi:hypothetical protein
MNSPAVSVSALRADLNRQMADLGKMSGLVGVMVGVGVWIVGAIMIAIVLEITGNNHGGTAFDSTGFNLGYILVCGIIGVLIAARSLWKKRRARIRAILEQLNAAGAGTGALPAATLATATMWGLIMGAGAVGAAVVYVIYVIVAALIIPLFLAMTFFAFLF